MARVVEFSSTARLPKSHRAIRLWGRGGRYGFDETRTVSVISQQSTEQRDAARQ